MKKGQITIYVIIGLLLVALAVTAWYLKDVVFESREGAQLTRTTAVPAKAEKVKVYTESCMKETLAEAVDILSIQGGYVNIPKDIVLPGPANPFSNALMLFNTPQSRVAYWYYETANGLQQVQIPTKRQMELELKAYVEQNIRDCLDTFTPMTNIGYDITYGTLDADVAINENDVILVLNFPVDVALDDFAFTIRRFFATVNYPLGSLYETAKKTIEAENKDFFLEQMTLDFMSIYEGIPYSGIDFTCSPKTWKRTDVIQSLREAIATNMPYIALQGTDYELAKENQKIYEVSDVKSAKNTAVSFFFSEDWPVLIDILDEDAEIIRGQPYASENELGQFLTPLFCINTYHFVYDLKFPVLVTLTKGDAVFQFATLVVIDNNQPRQNQVNLDILEPESRICQYPVTEMTVTTVAPQPNGALTALDQTRVAFKCLNYRCDMGTTGQTGTRASLTTDYPFCVNGFVIAEKEGYHQGKLQVSTNEPGSVSVVLEPIYKLKLDVKVQDNVGTRVPSGGEQISIQFVNEEQDYGTSAVYPGSATVNLIPGNYIITSSLLVNAEQGFKIQDQELEICNDVPKGNVLGFLGITEKKCEKQTIKGTTFDQVFAGGAEQSWTFTHSELSTARTLTVYTVRNTVPKTFEQLQQVQDKITQNSQIVGRPVLQ